MDRFTLALFVAPLARGVAKYIVTGLVGAAVAYTVDRGLFDAQLANSLANAILDALLPAIAG